jgi:hypothetical protein
MRPAMRILAVGSMYPPHASAGAPVRGVGTEDDRVDQARCGIGTVAPMRVERRTVWIFGSPRSGSTWLLNLLAADRRVVKMDEPAIGVHLGVTTRAVVGLADERLLDHRTEGDYFFSGTHRAVWEKSLRRLLLRRLDAQAPRGILIIKEPHGSDAADLLMRLTPRSRMIFLLRDGRDVVDSALDAATSWGAKRLGEAAADRVTYARAQARDWLRRTEIVERAFNSHAPDRRRFIRYEQLRADPRSAADGLAEWIGLDRAAVQEAADALAFERIPAEQRGPGRFARAATPGRWRESLSAEEREAVESVVATKVRSLGYPP